MNSLLLNVYMKSSLQIRFEFEIYWISNRTQCVCSLKCSYPEYQEPLFTMLAWQYYSVCLLEQHERWTNCVVMQKNVQKLAFPEETGSMRTFPGSIPGSSLKWISGGLASAKILIWTSNVSLQQKQFKKYYTAAVRKKGDTGANLIGILECRLDAILYRMKLAPTFFVLPASQNI